MDRLPRVFLLGIFCLGLPACSKAPQPGEIATNAAAPLAGMPDANASPDQTVTAFFQAAQAGNKPVVAALLANETAKTNVPAELDSCRNSRFQVGQSDFITPENDRAHVACVLIDRDEKGNALEHDAVCGLVKLKDGWRILGLVPVEPPPPGLPDKDASPDMAIRIFLHAAQTGDKPLLAGMLSSVARVETALASITFQLDSYQNSKFEIGKFEYVTPQKDGAHVACVWIDRDEQGNEYKHDVIWVLRKEPAGWRIVGMITRPFPDKEPVVFDYEDIPSLVSAKEFIEKESNRRDAEQRQAAEKKSPAQRKPLTADASPPAGQAAPGKDDAPREAMKPSPSAGAKAQ